MDVEQFKKDMGLEICEHNDPPCSFCMMKVEQILAHPFLAHYFKLLEQTRDKCPNCRGLGFRDKLTAQTESSGRTVIDTYSNFCSSCHGTGKTEPHPERLVLLSEDQSLPSPEPEFYKDWGGESGREGYRIGQQTLIKADWRKVKKVE